MKSVSSLMSTRGICHDAVHIFTSCFSTSITLLYSHLHLGQSLDISTNILYAFLICCVCPECPNYLTLLHSVTLIMRGWEWKLYSSLYIDSLVRVSSARTAIISKEGDALIFCFLYFRFGCSFFYLLLFYSLSLCQKNWNKKTGIKSKRQNPK
jgi:hypothetical protein